MEKAKLDAEKLAAEEKAKLDAEKLAAEEKAKLDAEKRAAEEKAKLDAEKMIAVIFEKSWRIYNKGEKAGFNKQRSKWLISNKIAVKA